MAVKFSQSHGIVVCAVPEAGNYNTPSPASMNSVNMSKYNHCTLIINGSDACRGAGILTVKAGLADAEETASVTFMYRISAADALLATGDTFGAAASSAALTFVEASIRNGTYVIEIDGSDLNIGGVQYKWITPILSAAGTAGDFNCIAILSEPKYEQNIMPTAI